MRTKFIVFALVVLVQLTFGQFATYVRADMLVIAGEADPRFGKVVESPDEGIIRFQVRVSEGLDELSFAKEDVELIVVNIDDRRLSRLKPERLSDYRDYAETLASQKRDPFARDLAIRLYLIAAANGFERQGDRTVAKSALAGLSVLGRTEQESRDFSVLRFVYDRRDHWTGAVADRHEGVAKVKVNKEAREKLLELLRMIRREDPDSAEQLLAQDDVQTEIDNWNSICSSAEIREMMSANRLSLDQLSKLLRLELAIQSGSVPRQKPTSSHWGEQSIRPGQGWTRLPDFSTVTEFDPQRSVYRDGEWVKPIQLSTR